MGSGSLRFKDEKPLRDDDNNSSSTRPSKRSSSRRHDRSHKRSKRRRTTESHSASPPASSSRSEHRAFTPEPEALDEPITPPRGGYKRTHYTLERESDFVDLPQPSAKYENDADFNERLFEAMREDEPAHDDLYYVPDRWRTTAATNVNANGVPFTAIQLPEGHAVNGLTDDQYAEYMRNGMWRKTHAEALKAAEARDRQRAQREKEAKHRREQARREEAQRIQKLAQAKRQLQKEKRESEREAYRQKWAALIATPKDHPLSSTDFPWPVSASSGSVTKASISDFLFDDEDEAAGEDDSKLRKQALRAAVLAYHPDRFDRFVQRVPEKHNQKEQVKEMGLRVSQILNELLGEL